MQVNVELTDQNTGDKQAMALLRHHVNERAERQYQIFTGALANFVKKHPQFIEMNSILQSSYHNLKIETDYNLSPKQAENSQKVYKGAQIIADGVQVDFSAVEFKGHGQLYKSYSMAEGLHFNDLPVGTPEEVAIKRAVGKAIITRELTAMLRGQAVDSDRHGQQQKIVVTSDKNGSIQAHVQNFDDGAMAVDPPTLEEQKVLGAMLGKMITLAFIQGMDISKAVFEASDKYRISEHSHYVETSKRGLRTVLGDYMNAEFKNAQGVSERLISNTDAKDILSAILRNGEVSHHILYPAAREIGYAGLCKIHAKDAAKAIGLALKNPIKATSKAFAMTAKRFQEPASVIINDSPDHLSRSQLVSNTDLSLKERFNAKAHNKISKQITNAVDRVINIFSLG